LATDYADCADVAGAKELLIDLSRKRADACKATTLHQATNHHKIILHVITQ
jgi:hypothetical protein